MLHLSLSRKQVSRPLKVLCLGAHADDIEIGCGGAVLKLVESHSDVCCFWMVFGASNKKRAREAVKSANLFLHGAKEKHIRVKQFKDGFFPFQGAKIKELFESIKREFQPDIIFTHYRDDLHQDHRVVSDLTWNTFRDHFILEYEIPKYDGDFGGPNLFVHLDGAICQKKVRLIMDTFQSQSEKHWFTEDTFLSVLRIRGIESCSPEKYAEAFYARKTVWDW
jgi:LmbE family N-acetylglucosaminyl deacetylase